MGADIKIIWQEWGFMVKDLERLKGDSQKRKGFRLIHFLG